MNYQQKYLEYKTRYLELKDSQLIGGYQNVIEEIHGILEKLPNEAICCYEDISNIYDHLDENHPVKAYMQAIYIITKSYINTIKALVRVLPNEVPQYNSKNNHRIGEIYFENYSKIVETFVNATHNVIFSIEKYLNRKERSGEIIYIAEYSRETNREQGCPSMLIQSCLDVYILQKLTRMKLHCGEIYKTIPDDHINKKKMEEHINLIHKTLSYFNKINGDINQNKMIQKYNIRYEDVVKGKKYQQIEIQKQQTDKSRADKIRQRELRKSQEEEREREKKKRRQKLKTVEDMEEMQRKQESFERKKDSQREEIKRQLTKLQKQVNVLITKWNKLEPKTYSGKYMLYDSVDEYSTTSDTILENGDSDFENDFLSLTSDDLTNE